MQADNVLDNQIRHALFNLRLHHKQLACAPLQRGHDNCARVAARARLAQARVERAEIHHIRRQRGVKAFVHQIRKRRVVAARGVILVLAGKRVAADFGADFHQREDTARRPGRFRATLHIGTAGVVKRHRHLFAFVAPQGLPLLPQIHIVGIAHHRLKQFAAPKAVFQGAGQHAVVMQHRADVDNVHLAPHATQRLDGLLQPALQFRPLGRVLHLLVVFDIVQHHQIGAVRAKAHAAQLFARARHAHLDVVSGNNRPCLPRFARTAGLRKIHGKAAVKLQLCLNRLQHGVGLVDAVHHNQRKMRPPGHNAPKRVQLRADGGFGFAPRRADNIRAAFGRFRDFRQPAKQVLVQVGFGGVGHVVRKIRLAKKLKAVHRVKHLGHARGNVLGLARKAVHRCLDKLAQLRRVIRQLLQKRLFVAVV